VSETPEHLLCQGRAVINELDTEQPFYFRFVDEHREAEGITVDAIRVPDFSVNCGQLSEPKDVLFPTYLNLGVGQFYIVDLPEPVRTGIGCKNEVEYTFIAQHDPVCDTEDRSRENYAHAEIRFLRNGVYKRGSSINSKVKFDFRVHMVERVTTVITPS